MVKTNNIKQFVSQLTLEEKASLCSGADFWRTEQIDRLGIDSIMVSDGPHGLRKQEETPDSFGVGESVSAVCFPSASALACSFDKNLIYSLGEILGEECQAESVSTLLGPGINMKRSPLCGRNFEYYSEDPYLTGEIASSFVNGVQSKGIGTSLKHFAANNQEYRRMSIDVKVDERTLREIYLSAFEMVVKKAKPTTVMCSYNRINGFYSSENDWLMNQVLRKEWGFEGLVMTDWGAMNERITALKAGIDLEMPSSNGVRDKEIVKAVNNGSLPIDILDTACERILKLVAFYNENKLEDVNYDKEAHHNFAKQISAECSVLLKNNGILPLDKNNKIAFIGEFAESPRYQGGGSSHVNSFKITNALNAADAKYNVTYARGYDTSKEVQDERLFEEAIKKAKSADAAVLFVGLPDSYESEGYDRLHMDLPIYQNDLIERIVKVQPNTVIVLHNGSPVRMPWSDKVAAILDVYLGGQAVGEATVDLLFGLSNPCGKLAETFPNQIQDNPSYLNFPGNENEVVYQEGIFIGYRYYDKKELEVAYPFGYGLSYTNFSYCNLQLDRESMKDTDTLTVSVSVKNTGNVFGKEIVQLYIKDRESKEARATKELKGFEKIALQPGEEKTVTFLLDKRAFAYYKTDIKDWYVESGYFDIMIGKSSRDILLEKDVYIESTTNIPFIVTDTTTIADIYHYSKDSSSLDHLLEKCSLSGTSSSDNTMGEGTVEMIRQLYDGLPLHAILSFIKPGITLEDINDVINTLNKVNS